MRRIYSTYEAKAKLSELLDGVRKGDIVTITHRGKPVAEVRPVDHASQSFPERVAELRRSGVVSQTAKKSRFATLARRNGALRRFLDSRE